MQLPSQGNPRLQGDRGELAGGLHLMGIVKGCCLLMMPVLFKNEYTSFVRDYRSDYVFIVLALDILILELITGAILA